VRDVRQVIPEDGIVALDNGMYKIWFARHSVAWVDGVGALIPTRVPGHAMRT
jgi:hypothetical protein